MASQPVEEKCSLRFTQGTSDKVYHLALVAVAGGFVVNAQYGRYGGPLTQDNKTKNGAVCYESALKIYEKVKREKIGKGYVEQGANGSTPAPQLMATIAPTSQKVHVQELLTEIDDVTAARLVADEQYWMQDKSDGHSRGVVKTASGVFVGLNKLGKAVPLPAEIVAELERIPLKTFQIDAEIVGAQLVCRDIMDAGGDIAAQPYQHRFIKLVEALNGLDESRVRAVPTWAGTKNKIAALNEQQERRAEGVVFKRIDAPHRPGRAAQHFKLKFVKTLSAIAGKPRGTGKESVDVLLYEDGKLTRVGSVSLIGKPAVKEGDILEVTYLYASSGKMLQQPRMQRVRDDVDAAECTFAQLVFKAED